MERSAFAKRTNKLIGLLTISILLMIFLFSFYFNKNFLILILALIIGMFISFELLKRDKYLIGITIFSSLILNFFEENLGFDKSITLILDYFIFLIAIKLFYLFINKKIKSNFINISILIFIIISLVGYFSNIPSAINYIKVLYFDYVRYFIICLAMIYFSFDNKYLIKLFKAIDIFILLQIPIILFQLKKLEQNYTGGYVIQDYASGLLGGKSTAELGGIIIILFTISLILFLNKKLSKKVFIINSILLVIISILSEIKFVLAMIPLMIFIVLIRKINLKSIMIFIVSLILVFEAMNLIATINPSFKNFFNKETLMSYINHSYGGSGISRGNSMSVANDYIENDISTILIGNGIGSSTNSFNQKSEFGRNNMYYFRMFYWPYLFVENGYLGLLIIGSIYIAIIFYSLKIMKCKNKEKKYIGQIGIPLVVLLIFMNYYAMSMVKINFAVIAWCMIGIIARTYYSIREEV
ncbi:hypothetical protein QYB59_002074 [Clostridium perfringens]|nr:hypothetical protein [Clostridium perfringens]